MRYLKQLVIPIAIMSGLALGMVSTAFAPAPPQTQLVVKNNTHCALSVRVIWGTGNIPPASCCAAQNNLVCISAPAGVPTTIAVPVGKHLCQLALYCPPNCVNPTGAVWNCPASDPTIGTCGACNFKMTRVGNTFDVNPI